MQLGLRALHESAFIEGNKANINQRIFDLDDIRLLERGRRAVGQWPPEDHFDAFLEVLNEKIDEAETSAERSKLECVREAALGVGRDVLASVSSAWARQIGGLPMSASSCGSKSHLRLHTNLSTQIARSCRYRGSDPGARSPS